jgi:hypothetical protein
MSIGVDFKTLVDARSVGNETVVSDFFDFPGTPSAGLHNYRSIELPLNVITAPSISDPIYVRQVDPTTHLWVLCLRWSRPQLLL